jgi:hypothetical protein
VAETIFFSWQVDTPPLTGRNFLERALERAIGRINDGLEVDEPEREELVVDRDTKGVAGQPPIVETIFKKIDATAVFVPDLTFVGTRVDGRPTPNPNVLIEYGWALKSLGHGRIVPVMNIAHGAPTAESMPFDMRHLRNPIEYDVREDSSEAHRKNERERLAKALEDALRAVFESEGYRARERRSALPAFEPVATADKPSRFRHPGVAIGIRDHPFTQNQIQEIYLTDSPGIWLRVMPTIALSRRWSALEIKAAATTDGVFLTPIFHQSPGLSYLRADDGFGTFAGQDDNSTSEIAFGFESGEVWSVNSKLISRIRAAVSSSGDQPGIASVESQFKLALTSYISFLGRLGLKPPYKWIAGMEGLKGFGLYHAPRPGHQFIMPGPRGSCVAEAVSEEGTFSEGQTVADALKPFFLKLFAKCGIERPAHLDQIES